MTLLRDPLVTINEIGLWLWLEPVTFKNVVKLVLAQSDLFANEADFYIHHLFNSNITDASAQMFQLPLIQRLLANNI